MTDVDVSEVPQGRKRRGSIEKKDTEDDAPDQTNLTAPDIAPDTISASASDEEPQPVERKQTQPYNNNKNTSNISKKPIIIANNKPIGHRRRNTDGALTFNPKTKMFNSNLAVIQLMAKELPIKERLAMHQKAQELKNERELKHAQIKLKEIQDQCNTAVEIIGKLEEEKEDLLSVNDTLRTQLGATTTEVKILEQKNKSLDELYRSDLRKYKDEASSTKNQLKELTEDFNQKDMALKQAKEYEKKLQQQLGDDDDEFVDENGNINNGVRGTKKEKDLFEKLRKEKTKINEKNNKIDELMIQLDSARRAQHEKENLQNEIDSFAEMAQQDLLMQKQQMEKMQREIITLASRNSSLEKERDDLMTLLEERDYENQMLKTGYGLHRNKTTNITQNDMNSIANQITGGDDDYDEQFNSLAFMTSQQPIDGDDINEYESEEYENRPSISDSPDKKAHKKEHKEVADVTREYLHLTASVVNMKFPRVQHIPSEELINKVKNYNFWEYHDMMVRIMKTEEQKLLAKEKALQEQKQQANQKQKPQSGGMLGKFRNFFGGGGGNQKNTNQKTNGQRDRKSMVDPSTQNNLKSKSNTRTRNKSATSRDKRGASSTDKKAPTADVAKQKLKEVKDSAKKMKDSAVKKVTNKPSDEESAKMADMSFVGIPPLDGYKNVEKANKPKQGL